MKKYNIKLTFLTLVVIVITAWACKKSFLDAHPYGQYGDEQLLTKKGVDGVLIGAYGMLDGESQFRYGENWATPVTNWVYGDIAADDAYKGTDANDQPNMTAVEIYNWLASNNYFYARWVSIYDGIARANDVLKIVTRIKAEKPDELQADDEKNIVAQARFIRGFQHFEAKRMWNNVPFVSDTSSVNPGNKVDIWPMIEEDFQFAYDNLPETQPEAGRVNKWAAAGYLAKALVYQEKFAAAKAIYDVMIPNGKTTNNLAYALQPQYSMNFDPNFENSAESVFAIQFAAQGTQEGDGNRGYGLAFPYGGDYGCCGFLQPSQNLVNAYKTDAAGLPMLDNFNAVDVKSDQGLKSSDPYTPDATIPLDPRLDWSVGRRGIPYYDFGPHPGYSWIRDQGYAGPYSPKKHIFSKAEEDKLTASGWRNVTAKNYNAMRFADVLLMAAECEVEAGTLAKAMAYVNMVRQRAANPAGFVKFDDGSPAPANYFIKDYTSFPDVDYARKAVRFERRLELGMEGHRFFDLVRYKIAEQVLNSYLAVEKTKRVYKNASAGFQQKNNYYPIPERIIVLSLGAIQQNSGY